MRRILLATVSWGEIDSFLNIYSSYRKLVCVWWLNSALIYRQVFPSHFCCNPEIWCLYVAFPIDCYVYVILNFENGVKLIVFSFQMVNFGSLLSVSKILSEILQ